MLTLQFECLVALAREHDVAAAAQACGVTQPQLRAAIADLEQSLGTVMVEPGASFAGFTRQGECVLAWARGVLGRTDELRVQLRAARGEETIAALLERRSVSPKRLGAPGPTLDHLDLILQAALRAPDHGGLVPWRVIEFRDDAAPRWPSCSSRRSCGAIRWRRRTTGASRASTPRARRRCSRSWCRRRRAARCRCASSAWPPAPRSATC